MKVFIDTSAFLALFIASESIHNRVLAKYQEYKKFRTLFLTSDYILDELYTRLIYDFNTKICQEKIKVINKAIKNDELNVLKIDNLLFKKSEDIFIKFIDHKISFTDAASYVCVKEFKLDEIFTLDSDFKKIGLKTSF